jgi:hypothetical protein
MASLSVGGSGGGGGARGAAGAPASGGADDASWRQASGLAGTHRSSGTTGSRAQLLRGNVPPFLRRNFSLDVTVAGRGHTLVFSALPDYLAIGATAADFVRIPTAAFTAQCVADAANASLPTTKMVDLMWRAAPVHVQPVPLPPTANMTSNAWFAREQAAIEAQLAAQGAPPRWLGVGGAKKDIVITNEYATHPNGTCIYGWPWLSGSNIQPLFCGHAAAYADYSHGVRLVSNVVLLDGAPMPLADVLADPVLSALISAPSLSAATFCCPTKKATRVQLWMQAASLAW